ncbi:transient receptor potential cation channel subfamily V member 5-like [Mercenaria mercenaria]|uniref:transient receptor potential cation channel subfamily V member 5-like n=1 Tax=Mercenaria mercenaria TaxID=6596 RepID=UPI00234F5B1A|nr:transient receptor potential cation channel subfamily V member 5-like [Mercenaria mercenaria]
MAFNIKSYKDYHRRLLFIQSDRPKYFREVARAVSLGEVDKVKILLDILKKEGQTKALASYKGSDGESMLHLAAMFNQSSEIIQTLMKICPELLTAARKESQDYYGQTALHIAIAKGNVDAVEDMLSEILNLSQNLKNALLHTMATGQKFANTVMMGELPLSVAALTFNFEMINVLMYNGAEMERRNTKGDTVFHSLIRFAAIYPELTPSVLATMEFLHEKIKEKLDIPSNMNMEFDHSDYSFIWFVPNNEDLNPLQLSAALSQSAIFQYILQLPKVYCFLNSHDGLFDRKSYDITEIDTISTEKWAYDQKMRRSRLKRHVAPTAAEGVSQKKFSNQTSLSCGAQFKLKREKRKSIMETMFDIKPSSAFEFIQQPTVRHVIKTKWHHYRWLYYAWAIFHLLFMVTLTVFSVYKAEDYKTTFSDNVSMTTTSTSAKMEEMRVDFLEAFQVIYLILGVLYLFMQLIHLCFRVKTFDIKQLTNVLHNGIYRIVLAIFAVSLILEFTLSKALDRYENYTLIIALITGWWFSVFFLRAWKKFSFFTVMIQKIIFGDLLRFSIIIVLMLIAFTAAVFMTFKGSATTDDNLLSFGHTMMLLFKLMLGLGDIETLYEARRPWMAVTLFIVFVLLTYVLMFNALIAMMSQTCAFVSDNRLVQWRVQQLSVIMFFEGILFGCFTKLVGDEKHVKRFDSNLQQVVQEKRYFLDMNSLQTQYANAEDIYSMKHKLQTLPFGGQKSEFYPSFNLTIPTPHLMTSPHHYTPAPIKSPTSAQGYRDNFFRPNTSIQITPASDRDKPSDFQQSPTLKRRKSKREKSPADMKSSPKDYGDGHSDSAPDNSARAVRQSKRKTKKKRVEPEGDINASYDDPNSEPHRFFLNQEHLTVPNPIAQISDPQQVGERRRYHSESGLIDTHIGTPIGTPMQQKFPIRRVQPTTERPEGSLDIGVIADSYM